jgi:biopolymer transport protein ExbD
MMPSDHSLPRPLLRPLPRTTRRLAISWPAAPWVCLLLPLAFFFLFHEFLVLPRGTRIELPTADTPSAAQAGERLFIVVIDAQNQFYFQNQRLDLGTLRTNLMTLASMPNAPQTLLVDADTRVPLARCHELAEAARAAGIRSLVIHTRRSNP